MRAHLAYLRYLLRHKYFVFLECCRLGIPLRGLLHDLSKFSPSEWVPYVDAFYGKWGYAYDQARDGGCADELRLQAHVMSTFDLAWLRHQRRNQHHWQYWCLREDSGRTKALPMPDAYRREMLADWRGAGLAQGKPDTQAWYLANRQKMALHPETRAWVEKMLGVDVQRISAMNQDESKGCETCDHWDQLDWDHAFGACLIATYDEEGDAPAQVTRKDSSLITHHQHGCRQWKSGGSWNRANTPPKGNI